MVLLHLLSCWIWYWIQTLLYLSSSRYPHYPATTRGSMGYSWSWRCCCRSCCYSRRFGIFKAWKRQQGRGACVCVLHFYWNCCMCMLVLLLILSINHTGQDQDGNTPNEGVPPSQMDNGQRQSPSYIPEWCFKPVVVVSIIFLFVRKKRKKRNKQLSHLQLYVGFYPLYACSFDLMAHLLSGSVSLVSSTSCPAAVFRQKPLTVLLYTTCPQPNATADSHRS